MEEFYGSDCGCDAGSLQAPGGPCTEPVTIGTARKFKLNLEGAIIIPDAWNIPPCQTTVLVRIPNFKSVPVGAYLWARNLGFFEILDQDEDNITLLNPCLATQGAVGTFVPENSTFILTASPVVSINTDVAYLANDFIAPPRGKCTTARFTSLNGIAAGMQVSIGVGSYWISESLGGGSVTLCENGGGLLPGTLVSYQNVFGQNQIPIYPISSSLVLQKIVQGGPVVISSDSPNFNVLASMTLKNPFVNRAMTVHYSLLGRLNGQSFSSDPITPIAFDWSLDTQFDDNFPTRLVTLKESVSQLNTSLPFYSSEIKASGVLVIPAETTVVLYALLEGAWNSANIDASINMQTLDLTITAIGALV